MGFKEFWESIRSDVNEKSRNPFLGTFIFVWVIRHWEPVYAFFNFNKSHTLDFRINKLKGYFGDYDFGDLAITLLVTFAAIISGYILLNITRAISNFFELKVTPAIYEYIDPGSVVEKSKYRSAIERSKRLENDLEKALEERETSKNEVEEWKKKFANKSAELAKFNSNSNKLAHENQKNDQSISYDTFSPKELTSIANKILDGFGENRKKVFYKVYTEVLNDKAISSSDVNVSDFIRNNYFTIEKKGIKDFHFLKPTPLGNAIYGIITGEN